jgi:hypothetical protein
MRRVGASIAADNTKSIRFCKHLGFVREGRIREGAKAGLDLLIFGMLRSECRFLGNLNEQAQPSQSTRSHRDNCGAVLG